MTDKRKAVDRQPGIAAEFAGQKRRLIVASFDQPGIMKRHRHDDVDPGFENILARHFQHGRQKPRIFGPVHEFESQNQILGSLVITEGRTAQTERETFFAQTGRAQHFAPRFLFAQRMTAFSAIGRKNKIEFV